MLFGSLMGSLSLSIISIIVLILKWYNKRQNEKITKIAIVVFALSLVSAFISILVIPIPSPTLHTSNGDSVQDNYVYIEAQFPLKIYYTTVPYEDPKNGEIYTDPIELAYSMPVSAKASLFGLFWSDEEAGSFIIGSDSIYMESTSNPASSIKEIEVVVLENKKFPGDVLSKSDLQVNGTTLENDTVILTDYDFEDLSLKEGINKISVSYKNLTATTQINVKKPSVQTLSVEFVGDGVHAGDKLSNDEFKVVAKLENGTEQEINDFTLSPDLFEDSGEQEVTISYEGVTETVSFEVYEKESAIFAINEVHTPNGGYDPTVSIDTWKENEDYTIDGKTYRQGEKITINNWMSGMMGNSNDFSETVVSKSYYGVNQDVLSKQEDHNLNGRIVVHRDTNGSSTTASVIAYADGKVVYESGKFDCVSTDIPEFSISADGVSQIMFEVTFQSQGKAFIMGIIFD